MPHEEAKSAKSSGKMKRGGGGALGIILLPQDYAGDGRPGGKVSI